MVAAHQCWPLLVPAAKRVWLLLLAAVATARSPEDATIHSGNPLWLDDVGNQLHAHGAGFILPETHPAGVGGKYFMVGTTRKHNPNWLSEGINMYSSYDLQTWHFENRIFQNTSITTPLPEGKMYRIERPKIIYNQRTRKYGECTQWNSGASM